MSTCLPILERPSFRWFVVYLSLIVRILIKNDINYYRRLFPFPCTRMKAGWKIAKEVFLKNWGISYWLIGGFKMWPIRDETAALERFLSWPNRIFATILNVIPDWSDFSWWRPKLQSRPKLHFESNSLACLILSMQLIQFDVTSLEDLNEANMV